MKTFLPVRRERVLGRVPWGYKVDESDKLLLLPIVEQLTVLEKAKDYLDKGASYKKTAAWMKQQTGVDISHVTLKNAYENDPEREEGRVERNKLVANYRDNNIKRKHNKNLTPEQRLISKIAGAKSTLTKRQKKLQKLREAQPEDIKAIPNAEREEKQIILPAEPVPDVKHFIQPNPGPQTDFLAAGEFEVLFGGQAGGGKQVSLDTIIPTTDGLKKMSEVEVGDYVYSDMGIPVKVIWKSEIDYAPDAYEIEFDTGEIVKCDAKHLWKTYTINDRNRRNRQIEDKRAKRRASRASRALETSKRPGVSAMLQIRNREHPRPLKPVVPLVRTTKEIYDTQAFGDRKNHSIPLVSCIVGQQKSLLVEPYLFGVWLGDGYSSAGAIGMSAADIDETLSYVQRPIHSRKLDTKNRKSPFVTVLFSNLTTDLKTLSVFKNKHIPRQYLTASFEQRLALLKGLMDTDGTASTNGKCSIMLTNKRLIEDVQELICTLGVKAAITTKRAKVNGKDCGEAYRICFCPPFYVFNLERKRKRQVLATRPTNFQRYIVSVRKCEVVPMQCIQVEHSDGMYCIGRTYIPTHNSHAIIIDPLRNAHLKSHRAITFRRTNDELRELIWMSKELYPNVFPGAKFSDQKSTWIFPSGGMHWFRYLDRDEDVLALQGQAFTQAYWDELTQWPSPFPFNYIRSRIRTTDDAIRPYLGQRATTNPGGPGHGWVKRMFIDPAPPGVPFPATDIETGEVLRYPDGHEKAGEPLFYRRFIPSRLADNPYLYKDGSYERTLMSLPEVQRRQLLEGDWDVAEGAAFSEFNRRYHVCDPFEIPSNWPRFRAADWGYESHACCLWFAEDNDKKLYVYRELYTHKVLPEDFAKKVLELEQGEPCYYGFLDSSCWGGRQDGGPPIVQMMNNAVNLAWRPADRSPGSRRARKQEVHARLKLEGEYPNIKTGLTIFNNCINLIRTLPVLPLDKNNPEDVDTKMEDHAYDALAYGCAARPYGRHRRYSHYSSGIYVPADRPADSVFGY